MPAVRCSLPIPCSGCLLPIPCSYCPVLAAYSLLQLPTACCRGLPLPCCRARCQSWKLSLLVSRELPTFQELFSFWLGMKTNIPEISWIT